MNLEEIIKILKNLKPLLKSKYKVNEIGIFGSWVQNQQNENSDIDLLVDFENNADMFDLIGLSIFLEEKLEYPVDIIPKNALRKELQQNVFSQLISL